MKPDIGVIKRQKDPMLIPDLKNIVQLSVGYDFCLALDVEGTVFSWGNGEQCQLGRRIVERRRTAALVPTRVALPKKKIISIHTGSDHASIPIVTSGPGAPTISAKQESLVVQVKEGALLLHHKRSLLL
jgi:hypothetical protein